METRLRKLEGGNDDNTVVIAGLTMTGAELTTLLHNLDGKTRGLPSSQPHTSGRGDVA